MSVKACATSAAATSVKIAAHWPRRSLWIAHKQRSALQMCFLKIMVVVVLIWCLEPETPHVHPGSHVIVINAFLISAYRFVTNTIQDAIRTYSISHCKELIA